MNVIDTLGRFKQAPSPYEVIPNLRVQKYTACESVIQ